MELRQLRYFIGVVEAGSLLQASTRLHIAQPALGQQIAALEHALGAQLFVRSSRGMRLTEAGTVFLEHARVVLADADRAREAVRASRAVPSGPVSLGLPTTVGLVATVPILSVSVSACRERLPQIRLRVVEGYGGFLRAAGHCAERGGRDRIAQQREAGGGWGMRCGAAGSLKPSQAWHLNRLVLQPLLKRHPYRG